MRILIIVLTLWAIAISFGFVNLTYHVNSQLGTLKEHTEKLYLENRDRKYEIDVVTKAVKEIDEKLDKCPAFLGCTIPQ